MNRSSSRMASQTDRQNVTPCSTLGMMQVMRTDFEQPIDRSHEFRRRNTECFAYPRGRGSRHVRARLDEIHFSVANDDLVGRQVVVNVREMDRENFVSQKRKRLEWIQRIDRQKARQFPMFSNRFHRAIQRRHRIVGQQEAEPRIVLVPRS